MPRKKLDPTEARDRRLSSYPPEFWEILRAAQARQNFVKTFQYHNWTCSFLARFYRFRMDAIAARVPGAGELRQLMATGRDANGDLFSTNNKMGQGPYTITWHYIDPPEAYDQVVAVPQSQPGSQSDQSPDLHYSLRQGQANDEAEQLTRKWLKSETEHESSPSPQPPTTHVCSEWNEYEACVECGKPKEL